MIVARRSLNAFLRDRSCHVCFACRRNLSRSAIAYSGHSKWASIKHDKAKNDASLSKQRMVHAKAIADATRVGGADLDHNPRLALAIATAKKAGFPKASIETAILRGQGRSASGAALENMTIEAVVPPVGVIIDCQTDSKARTLQDLRGLLKNHGGAQSPSAYLFEKRGRITFQIKEGVGADDVLETALEAGALDVDSDGVGRIVLDTEVDKMMDAEKRLVTDWDLEVESSDTIWFPNEDTRVGSIEQQNLAILRKLQDELEDYPGVQGVYMNIDISQDVSAQNEPTTEEQ